MQKSVGLLPDHLRISIFDVFRTIETQAYLFKLFCEIVQDQHPDWEQKAIEQEALKFVSHPYEKSRFAVPLHNSGGAVDLELIDLNTHQVLDFGTKIDTLSELSYTDFFERPFDPSYEISGERWMLIRDNRRLLFNAMKAVGFVNFHHEWWHYDIGNCNWAHELKADYVFESMEPLVLSKYKEKI